MLDNSSRPVRRPSNVSLDQSLVEKARSFEINLSRACERGLAAQIKASEQARWLAENAEAIASWNDYVEKNGLPLAKYRQF